MGTHKIRLQYRVNGEIIKLTNAVKLEVVSSDSIAVPQIASVSPEELSLSNGLFQNIIINAENVDENTELRINGEIVESEYADGCYSYTVRASKWLEHERLGIQIRKYINDGAQYIDSDTVYLSGDLPVTSDDNDSEDSDEKYEIFESYLDELDEENNLIVITACGDVTRGMTDSAMQELQQLGLQVDLRELNPGSSYLAVINDGNVIVENVSSESAIEYAGIIDECLIYAQSAGYFLGNYAVININNLKYCLDQNGLNIVSFDTKNNTLVDSIVFNVNDGFALNNQ